MCHTRAMEIAAWLAQLRKGAAEMVVLAIVNRKASYGVEILEQANRAGEIVTEGGLYPLLMRLEKDGKLSSRWVTEGTPQPRKYYQITREGAALLSAMKDAWIRFRIAISLNVEDEQS